jgi:PAS domain S-box-containing protein
MRSYAAEVEPVRQRQFTEALAALREALQEIEVVEEELRRQNEELVAAREELEIERHRYRDLFDLAPIGYVVTDAAGVIQEANLSATRLLNGSRRALRGKPLAVYIDRKERSDFRALLQEVRRCSTPLGSELVLWPRDAPPRVVLCTVVRDDDKPAGERNQLRWILQDISDRRAAEEALLETQERLRHSQKLEAIGRLAGGVAHSFNNLLAAISFHAELILEEGCSREGLRRHAIEIQNAGERAAALARQLLAFSRKQVLQPRRLRLNEVIANLEPMLRRLLGESVELEVELDPEAGTLLGDLGQLEQVLLNLVTNARDAMPQGGRLRIATRQLYREAEVDGLPAGHYLALVVEDTGSGMGPEVRERLFEPFFTTKERGRGTGLGLATVYGIVQQSGGDIRVSSEPGKGTTFTVLLLQTQEEEGGAFEALEVERATPHGTELVLLVEDEDNIREPAVEILESYGYHVLAARDAAEALAISRQQTAPIHLMITDVVMPGLSGGQLAETLQPERPDMGVLFMSGYPEDSIAHQGMLDPKCHFLQKPFPPSVLLRKVREVLDGRLSLAATGR